MGTGKVVEPGEDVAARAAEVDAKDDAPGAGMIGYPPKSSRVAEVGVDARCCRFDGGAIPMTAPAVDGRPDGMIDSCCAGGGVLLDDGEGGAPMWKCS